MDLDSCGLQPCRVLAEEERRGTIAKRRRSIELLDVEELSRWARWPGDADDPA